MKFVRTLLVALAAGVAVYAARRRLKYAITTAVTVYLVLLPLRLLFVAGELFDRLDSLVVPALIVGAVWVALWQVSLRYEQRKRRRAGRREA